MYNILLPQVATRGTIIYFIMSDLTLLNCMYNFSLEMFMNVFKTTVHSLGNSYLAPDQVWKYTLNHPRETTTKYL